MIDDVLDGHLRLSIPSVSALASKVQSEEGAEADPRLWMITRLTGGHASTG